MAGPRKVCVVTGSRADYGLLYWVLKELQQDPAFRLQIAATGMHLSAEFGSTWRIIEEDGFRIDEKVEMLDAQDTPEGIARSIGRGTIGFAAAFARLQPELLVLLGDRFEMLAAAQAALVANIPIAHIAGGDSTEGAFDEAIRHSVTKMSHLHFVTNEDAARRVRQLGEDPAHVFNFGSPGIDAIRRMTLLDRDALERALEFRFQKRNLLVTFHPVTLEFRETGRQLDELLAALERFVQDTGILLTGPNADTGGRELAGKIEAFARRHSNARFYASLGQQRYLSAMAQVDAVVGNSSSGLYEAPSLKKPTVNIGERQRGRMQAPSVVNCPPQREAIIEAIHEALALDCSRVVNPYGDGDAAPRIVATLKSIPDYSKLLTKPFFDQVL